MDGVIVSASRPSCGDKSSGLDYRPPRFRYTDVIDEICKLDWESLSAHDVMQVAEAYYFFSVQFRENLEVACRLFPTDDKLSELREGECETDNLSPYPGVAAAGERLDHDEFVRRAMSLETIDRTYLPVLGQAYLRRVRALPDRVRAVSIASYEDGGLSRVFAAMLRAPEWRGAGSCAFKFFLEQHIRFDSVENGHGALSRHLAPDDTILPLWIAFRELLVAAVPRFWRMPAGEAAATDRDPVLAVAAA